MSSFAEKVEEAIPFRQRVKDFSAIFLTKGSTGKNPVKLARILVVHDLTMKLMNWQDKPLANLTQFLTDYQASIDGAYHKDYKDIQIAEEIENKRAKHQGISIVSGASK